MAKPTPLDVTVDRVIDAPADTLYDLVSDVTRMGDYSPENTGAVWLAGRPARRWAPASRAAIDSDR